MNEASVFFAWREITCDPFDFYADGRQWWGIAWQDGAQVLHRWMATANAAPENSATGYANCKQCEPKRNG